MRRFIRVGGALDRLGGSSRPALRFARAAPEQRRLHQDGPERIAEIVGDDAEHVVPRLAGSLRRAVEPGVLEREGRSPGDLLSEADVCRPVRPRGRRGHETHYAQELRHAPGGAPR